MATVDCLGDECRGVRVPILSLGEAIYTPIPDGSWLASCARRVQRPGVLGCAMALAAPPNGWGDIRLGCEVAVPCVGDADENGAVTVDKAVGVVGNAVEGCPAQ